MFSDLFRRMQGKKSSGFISPRSRKSFQALPLGLETLEERLVMSAPSLNAAIVGLPTSDQVNQATGVTVQANVTGATGSVHYSWILLNSSQTAVSSGSSGAFTFAPPTSGTYDVSLSVTDGSGATATANQSLLVASGGLMQGGFETPSVGTGNSAYAYGPNGSAWSFVGGGGVAGNNSGFTSGNPVAPGGTQVAFLQGTGSASQTASLVAGTYTLAFAAAQRGNYQATYQTIRVQVDGSTVGTFNPTGTSYAAYATTAFTVTAGTHTITFAGIDPNSGDNTAFVDQVQLNAVPVAAAPGLQQGGFETPSVGTGSSAYKYGPSGSAWTFANGGGLAGNNSAFTSGNPVAPEGTQVAFLQGTGSATESATLAAGTYNFSFAAAQRGNYQASSQTFQVQVDGTTVGTFKPGGTSYTSYTTSNFTVTAGTHTITFVGTDPNGGDNTAFVDQVQLNTVTTTAQLQASITGAPTANQSNAGTQVTLNAQVTGGATGTDTYSWVATTGGQTIATGNTATFSYTPANPATDQVALTVTDSSGATATASLTLTIKDVAPSVTVADPPPFPTGKVISFSASATDVSPAVNSAGYTYSWNFGDGTTTSGSPTVSHAFSTPGTYTITATATDEYGNSSSGTTTVVVVAPLQATITGAPNANQSNAGAQVTLGAQVSGGATGQDTYSWVVTTGGQTIATCNTAAFSYTPANPGTDQVALTVTDSSGATATSALTLTIKDVAPTLTISGPTSGPTQQALSFTATATDISPADNTAGYTYQWTFGDGATAATATASHAYAAAGTYTVTVSATDTNGTRGTATSTVTVGTASPPAPVASAGPNKSAAEGATVTFAGSETGGTTPITYAWTFGDGGTSSGSLTPTHVYQEAGTYTATLTVTDALGRTSSSSDVVTISLVSPTAIVGGPYNGTPGTAISFTGSATDPTTYDTAVTNTYRWTFGDGSTAATASASHTYASAGTYTATLTVTDREGAIGTSSTTVTVGTGSSPAPVANAGPNESAAEGANVTFAGSETGGTTPLTYAWTFGDGGTASGSLTPTHVYQQAGTYTATLTVTDALGRTSSSSDAVTVSLVAPTVALGGPYNGTAGTALNFAGSATDPTTYNTAATNTYSWNFGDGSTATGQSVSHNYATAGTYTVTLTVTDKEGSSGSASTYATISTPGSTTTPDEPLLYSSDVQYVGAFRVPNYYDGAGQMSYGGNALAYNPADNSLFIVGYNDDDAQPIAEISIPDSIVNSSNLDSLTTDTVLQPWTNVLPQLPNPLTGASDGAPIGGLMVYDGQLIGTDFAYYSGANTQVASHFVLSSLNLSTASVSGLYQVGSGGRMMAGPLTPIPSEWQASLGGFTALTGLSDQPIIDTESSGPAAIGFNPADLGSASDPASTYLNYPNTNPLGAYSGPANPMQSGTTSIGGDVFVPGTSSILYFGETGTSYEGYGDASPWAGINGGKGPQSLNGQYSFQVWAYNANDFAAVQQGKLQPDQVMPYDVWNFNLPISAGYQVGGVAFDASSGRIYVSLMNADHEASASSLPLIEVFQVNVPSGAPAVAAPQIGTLTGAPSITPNPSYPSSDGAAVPQWVGTYAGPVNPGDPVLLTAGNVYAINAGDSITQVKFYLSSSATAPFSATSDTLLGSGTGANNLPTGGSTNWTLTMSTTGLSAGTYTIYAQAQDSDGLVSDPIAWTLTIS